jgi:chromate transport protein ChrA
MNWGIKKFSGMNWIGISLLGSVAACWTKNTFFSPVIMILSILVYLAAKAASRIPEPHQPSQRDSFDI